MERINVYKLGGDITSDPEKIEKAAYLIHNTPGESIIVVSAFRGVTKQIRKKKGMGPLSYLVEKHVGYAKSLGFSEPEAMRLIEPHLNDLNSSNRSQRESLGERLALPFISRKLEELGFNVAPTTGYDLGLAIRDQVAVRESAPIVARNLLNYLEKGLTPVPTGFDGVSVINGQRADLGPSGSDQSATFIKYALSKFPGEVYLVKNQKGVETSLPNVVSGTVNVPGLTYREGMEGNLQLESLQFAEEKGIPVIVQYIGDPDVKTIVNGDSRNPGVALVTGFGHGRFLRVHGIRDRPGAAKEVMDILYENKINTRLILDTEHSISFVVDSKFDSLDKVKKSLEDHLVEESGCSVIRAVGNLDWETNSLFHRTVREVCNPISASSWVYGDPVSSIVIPEEAFEETLQHVHDNYVLPSRAKS